MPQTTTSLGSERLHQNIDGYAAGASRQDAAEWEKVSGRFQTLNFNEPATTLLKLCSAKLEQVDYGADHKQIKRANAATHKSNLLPRRLLHWPKTSHKT